MKKYLLLTIPAALAATLAAQAETFIPSPGAGTELDPSWTVIDGGAIGSPYKFHYEPDGADPAAVYQESKDKNADDWLITAAFPVRSGREYSVAVEARSNSSFTSDKQVFSIYVGTEPTEALASATRVYSTDNFTSQTYTEVGGTFTATEAGDYYVGLHLTTNAWSGGLNVRRITVTELGSGEETVVELPYSENLDTKEQFETLTLFHGPEGDRDWSYYANYGCMQFWGGDRADAWVATPKFHLLPGTAYQLTYSASIQNDGEQHRKDLYIHVAGEVSAEGFADGLIFSETVDSSTPSTRSVIFSVETEGNYAVGFHCYGPSSFYPLMVDDLTLAEVEAAPNPAAEATATAAPAGELSVEIAWTNPSLNSAGIPLTAIEGVDVRCGDRLVATVDNALPGGMSKVTDNGLTEAGTYTYQIVVRALGQSSTTAEATVAWVGADTPTAPTAVTATSGEGVVTITFDHDGLGQHGGYVDGEQLGFDIAMLPGGTLIAEGIREHSFVWTPDEMPSLNLYTFVVTPRVGETTGESASSEPLMLGNPLGLPYQPDFTSAEAFAIWTLTAVPETGKTWNYNPTKQTLEAAFTSPAGAPWAFTPPLAIDEAGKYTVTHRTTCYYAPYPETFEIWLCRSDDPANETKELIASCSATETENPTPVVTEFEVAEPGSYRLAFHCTTTGMQMTLSLVDLLVEKIQTTSLGQTDADLAWFDPSTGVVTLPEGMSAEAYSATGQLVAAGAGSVDLTAVGRGLYLIVVCDAAGQRTTLKVRY
ncbi:MAG: hypothetical protein NC336_08460 [Clostridium sp.]|nr:hypothetical protein [Clostridium sp.]